MYSSLRTPHHALRASLGLAVLCLAVLVNVTDVQANEWVGIDPISPIEPIATDHALVEHPFRTPSKPKTWIVERTQWPNPGLLRKIDPGVVVRVLEQGIQHNGEWLRVETIDAERTQGLAMAHLLIPARSEDVRAAFQAEQRAIEQAIAEATAEQQRLQASARRVLEEAQRLEAQRVEALTLRVPRLAPAQSPPKREGIHLAAQAFKAAVETMRSPAPRSSAREVRIPGAPAALATQTPSAPAPLSATSAPQQAVEDVSQASRPLPSPAGAATPAQAAPAPTNAHGPGAQARPVAGAIPPAQVASASTPPTSVSPSVAPAAATAPPPAAPASGATFAEASVPGKEQVLAIGQPSPQALVEAARAVPPISWGRIALFIMLLVGVAAGLIHLNEVRKDRAAELVTLSSVPLAGDSSLSLVKAQQRTLVVGTTPQGVQLVTDLGQGQDLAATASSFVSDYLVPSVANSRPAPLSRLLRDEPAAPLATKSDAVRRLAAAKRKIFGGAA